MLSLSEEKKFLMLQFRFFIFSWLLVLMDMIIGYSDLEI